MGRFLNSILPFESYKDIVRTRFFVDKSLLIEEIISAVVILEAVILRKVI